MPWLPTLDQLLLYRPPEKRTWLVRNAESEELGKDCVMDKESDGRRKLFSKRKIESLEQDRALFIRLVEKIRDSDRKDLDETIEFIRGGASLTSLKSYLLDDRSIDLACDTPANRDEAITDNRRDLKANGRQAYLDVANIIE
ncbi:hypothetical protein N7509_000054 [Penicillium cosmopolitanum]|uniref:Uncharacterized protein n=1 Tax=Penicillium cosmopolitanum TaxID=1131564 RepID=A0A9W9WCP2_9EURO|nr:uncharacterized protein N7509_000054 [Penicillium cosmopolitanum]KAJ5414956.1 hypothetical protein N7509_000054 [Penicillium cosmopolitanum]